MPATRQTRLSPEMALITRYRKREGTPEPEIGFKPAARKIAVASGDRHLVAEQYWRRREHGEVQRVDDTPLAWMAWAVDVPPDELAATGRTEAADLLRQIIADQDAKAAQAPDRLELSEELLQQLVRQRMEKVRRLHGITEEDCERIEKFFRQRIQQAFDDTEVRIEALTRR
ncbi:hypothetical protein [Nonomuraea sp. SYSU D8015]|uniref:hypothetical protein n=1 Tax=Nonomuraea sp. SYSU D8015 TaxID=2593644 RepID=UPI001660D59A|nr:hypothetical protein [Nonomuraea sp. SYSU D8015]